MDSYKGKGEGLKILLKDVPESEDLRDLAALFFRYGVDMHQLAQFLTEQNRQWFRDPQKYWYAGVFGEQPT